MSSSESNLLLLNYIAEHTHMLLAYKIFWHKSALQYYTALCVRAFASPAARSAVNSDATKALEALCTSSVFNGLNHFERVREKGLICAREEATRARVWIFRWTKRNPLPTVVERWVFLFFFRRQFYSRVENNISRLSVRRHAYNGRANAHTLAQPDILSNWRESELFLRRATCHVALQEEKQKASNFLSLSTFMLTSVRP